MEWLNKLFGSSGASGKADRNVLWLYAQCGRCHSVVSVRINRSNDITPDYDTGGGVLRKEIMDSKCFQLMHAELHFDPEGKETERTIEGGRFITREQYEAEKEKA